MKIFSKTLVVLVLIVNFHLMCAQETVEDTYYGSGEFNMGNYFGVNFDLNYVFKNKYSVKFGFSGNLREPKSQPEDFSNGVTGLLTFGTENPYDHLLTYRIDVGRIYNLNQKGTIRANLAIGLGFTTIKEPGNWQAVDGGTLIILTDNYTYSYNSYNTFSFIINPKIEFPFTKIYGFSVSPMIQLNKDRSYFGIGVGSLLGKLK